MGDDITIGVTEIVNNIEVTAQPNDQIVDISVIDNADDVTLNITPTVIEINVNKGSSYAKWGTILGTLSDQTDLQDALDLKADLVDGKVPSSQLPSYVDDVIEVANYAALPTTGETGKIYITLDNNKVYRWSGSVYIEIAANNAVWGAITGTLSNQTDLQSALNAKVPYSGASGNVNLGEYGITSGYVGFDTTPTSTPTGIGTMYWDSANRTVSLIDGDGDTTLQIGQEQRILVHNNTGSTLTDGQVVYVTGSTGNLPSVALASATIESTSAATIGVVTESIANGADGFITTSGIVNGLNTLAFNEGDLLWLGTTAGTFSTTKPTSPNHLVLIGYVIKKAGGNGSILVKIQNTQELDECSDVLFSGLANNDLLVYETASALWKNKSLATVLGYTPANDTNVVHKTGNESIAGWKTFTGGITIWDNSSNNLLDFFISGTEVGSISVGSSFFQFKALNSNGYLFQNNSGSNSLTISNSGNGTFLGSVTATSIIKSGGTSSQFLKADGSVDSNTYATTSQLHNAVTIGTANGLSLSTQVLSLGLASSSTNGALSSTDWNTFNNKQSALSGTGFVKISGTTITYDNNTYALDSSVVKITGDQSISGTKIFSTGISTNTITSNSFIKTGGTSSQFLKGDGSVDSTSYQPLLTNPITGTGTTNYLSKFTGSGTLGNSSFFDNGGIDSGITNASYSQFILKGNGSNDVGGGVLKFSNQTKDFAQITGETESASNGMILFRTLRSGSVTEAIRITSSGNVGIGTTSPSSLLHLATSSGNGSAMRFESTSTNGRTYGIGSNFATGVGEFAIYDYTANAERMRITSGGNVGIGTTTPSEKLQVGSSSGGVSTPTAIRMDDTYRTGGDSFNNLKFYLYKSSTETYGFGLGDLADIQYWAGTTSTGTHRFFTSQTERMRITSGGDVFIGSTVAANSEKLGVNFDSTSRLGIVLNDTYTGVGSSNNVLFKRNGSNVGSISTTTTMTSYNITSDYRLKEDLKNYSGLDLISNINTYDFKWKNSEDRMYGVIAHELQEVVPYAVNGEKDAEDMQQVDYSKLVPILVEAIKQLNDKINKLENK